MLAFSFSGGILHGATVVEVVPAGAVEGGTAEEVGAIPTCVPSPGQDQNQG